MLAKLNRTTGGIFVAASLGALSIGATANAQETFEITGYRIESNDCPGCEIPIIQSEADAKAYLESIRAIAADGDDDDGYGGFERDDDDEDGEAQAVFVDFDAGGDPTFPVCFIPNEGPPVLFGVFNDHIYTEEERETILARIRADYGEFDYDIDDEPPEEGPYTTLFIGQNDAPFDCSQGSNILVFEGGGISILFGRAETIDFRNRIKDDNAFADASLWEFLIQLDPSAGLFTALSGVSPDDFGGDVDAAVSFAVVNQTSNTGAHEIGHLQGLRHQDSFGPPGGGLPTTGAVAPNEFVPLFDGPIAGDETVLHTMASGASVGLSLRGSTITDRFFSERSAVRIAVANGKVRSEAKIRKNGRDKISLAELDVPNTIMMGQNLGADLEVKSLVVKGEIDQLGQVDRYTFRGQKGRYANVKLVSVIGDNLSFEEGILGEVELWKVNKDGSETFIAAGRQGFESVFDAEIFDEVLPENGTYAVYAFAPDGFYPTNDESFFLPLSLIGFPELNTGAYSLHVWTLDVEFDDDDDDDDD